MEKKQYATYLRMIFGDPTIDDALSDNEELAQAVSNILEETWKEDLLEFTAIDAFVLEGKDTDAFAQYIREHADELAKQYMGRSLRALRHPEKAKPLRRFL